MEIANEFLSALLQPAPSGSLAWCTQFAVPPERTTDVHWTGALTTPEDFVPVKGENAYYSIAAFPPDAPTRKARHMEGVAVVLLDDVYDPGEVRRLLGEPSFRITTSPASEQWGYLLSALATKRQIQSVHDALEAEGLCDMRCRASVRYGRLPTGINNKLRYGTEPFVVRLLEWHSERRLPVRDVASKLADDEKRSA